MKPGKVKSFVMLGIVVAMLLLAIFGLGDGVKGVRDMRYGIDIRGGVEAVFQPENLDRKPTAKELNMAREIIENRLDAEKIADREVTIDKEGGYVIVRFPWKSDEKDFKPEDAIAELGDMAQLSFRDENNQVLMDGKHIVSATASKSSTAVDNTYEVQLEFDSEGAKEFEDATSQMVGKNMGIYMDETQIKAPLVQQKITGGNAVIDHIGTYKEAKDLAEKINSGALPFSLKTTSFNTISPTLGNQSLQVMGWTGLIAFGIIVLFMLLFYQLPGAIACITLVLQMSVELLLISIPQYTLTLPGIAGIILTLGMSVDTNIIIAERISDELKRGEGLRGAVTNGYKNAFSAVIDGNVTTAIVAVILMIFGSGSMLSFGYTLLIGMIVNLLIGVNVSKQLQLSALDFPIWNQPKWYRKRREQKVIPFYAKRKLYLVISLSIMAAGVIGTCINGIHLDTQFTGGAVLTYEVEGKEDLIKIQQAVGKVTDRTATVQQTRSNTDSTYSLELTLAGNRGLSPQEQEKITEAVKHSLGDQKLELTKTYAVEPYIGAKAMKNAVIAIVLSAVFIIFYVWLRFSSLGGLPAGLTSVFALVHDCLVVLTVFILFKIPLNDAFVAVVLTIIGYSINDTIVLYDRIRENKQNHATMSFIELNDMSTTQVITRSVNTSITTMICIMSLLAASLLFQIESIRVFALPMMFGLLSGCYSSICIASILWAKYEEYKVNKKAKVK